MHKTNYACKAAVDGAKNGRTVQKTRAKTRAKSTCKNTCKFYFASNCDKPLITKLVRRKILHETVVRAICDVLEPYHNFMQNFTSLKFCDQRFDANFDAQCDAKKILHVFCMGF